MKNLMRVMSILIAFCGIMVIIITFMDVEDLLTNKGNYDFYMFAFKIFAIFTTNILPIISIAICAYCLERNDNNYIIRIIPIYMSIPIVISIIMALFDTNADWLVNIYQFLSSTFLGVTALSLIMVIKANNKITTILKYIAVGILVLNVILAIITQVKSYMVDTLPNVYGYKNYGGFNFSTVEETNEFTSKLYSVTSIAEIFVIILLFTTNYAFSDTIELETEDIDYEAVKQDALNVANTKMNEMYSIEKPKEIKIKQEQNEDNNKMNISNQLGVDSNVGTVQGQAKEVKVASSIDSFISLSQGPIVNNAVSNNENQEKEEVQEVKPQEQEVKQEPTPVPSTQAPNLDIQEQMKMKINEQNTQQQAPQMMQQNNQASPTPQTGQQTNSSTMQQNTQQIQ